MDMMTWPMSQLKFKWYFPFKKHSMDTSGKVYEFHDPNTAVLAASDRKTSKPLNVKLFLLRPRGRWEKLGLSLCRWEKTKSETDLRDSQHFSDNDHKYTHTHTLETHTLVVPMFHMKDFPQNGQSAFFASLFSLGGQRIFRLCAHRTGTFQRCPPKKVGLNLQRRQLFHVTSKSNIPSYIQATCTGANFSYTCYLASKIR